MLRCWKQRFGSGSQTGHSLAGAQCDTCRILAVMTVPIYLDGRGGEGTAPSAGTVPWGKGALPAHPALWPVKQGWWPLEDGADRAAVPAVLPRLRSAPRGSLPVLESAPSELMEIGLFLQLPWELRCPPGWAWPSGLCEHIGEQTLQ